MKKRMMQTLALLLAVLMLGVLCSCGQRIPQKQVEEDLQQLFAHFEKGEWEAAAALFHPEGKVTGEKLKQFCEQAGVQQAISFVSVDSYESIANLSLFGGTSQAAKMTFRAESGGRELVMLTEVQQDRHGYGFVALTVNNVLKP